VFVDNVKIFTQKFNAVPELQAFKVTYRTPFSARDFVQIIKVQFLDEISPPSMTVEPGNFQGL